MYETKLTNSQLCLHNFVCKNKGTKVIKATAGINQNHHDLTLGILSPQMFPSDCITAASMSALDALIHHPRCSSKDEHSSSLLSIQGAKKKAALEQMGSWLVPNKYSFKAVVCSFPESGGEQLRYIFEQVTGKIGSTNSSSPHLSVLSALPGEQSPGAILTHVSSVTSNKIDKQAVGILKSGHKRVIIIRDPFDAIWSAYQVSRAGSRTKGINKRDFRPNNFARFALQWAHLFKESVSGYEMAKADPRSVLVIKFEDLMNDKDQSDVILSVLNFLGEESHIDSRYIDMHPLLAPRPVDSFNLVTKSVAYSTPTLVDDIWAIIQEVAERFEYIKPSFRFLTYEPTGGLTNQLMSLELAIKLAKESHRTLLIPPLISEDNKIFPELWKDSKTWYACTDETLSASACNNDFKSLETFSWEKVLDIQHLTSRVEIIDELPVAAELAEQSLCQVSPRSLDC